MAIKRINTEQSEKLLLAIETESNKYGVKTDLLKILGRDACVLAEAIFKAVDNYRAANRKPRPPKRFA